MMLSTIVNEERSIDGSFTWPFKNSMPSPTINTADEGNDDDDADDVVVVSDNDGFWNIAEEEEEDLRN